MLSHLSAQYSAVPKLPYHAVFWFSSVILRSVTSDVDKFLYVNYPIYWTSPENIYLFKVSKNKKWNMIKVDNKETITTSVVLVFLFTLNK